MEKDGDKNDDYTLRWLTNDCPQSLTMNGLETSSSSTDDDDVHTRVSVEMGSLGPTKACGTMNFRSSYAGLRSEQEGVQTLLFCSSFLR